MKKFKTSADKRNLEQQALSEILSEKNLLYTALIRYTHVPLGLMTALLMLLTSWLVERPLLSWENALFVYFGIGGIALFYMLQAWFGFQRNRALLQHVRNDFVGSRIYPLLFASILLYMAFPLGKFVLVVVLGLLLLLGLYHLKVRQRPLWSQGHVGSLIFSAYAILLLWIPVVAPGASPSMPALAVTLATGLVFGLLSLRFRHWLHLDEMSFSQKLSSEF